MMLTEVYLLTPVNKTSVIIQVSGFFFFLFFFAGLRHMEFPARATVTTYTTAPASWIF